MHHLCLSFFLLFLDTLVRGQMMTAALQLIDEVYVPINLDACPPEFLLSSKRA
jgi:hypothetical protein